MGGFCLNICCSRAFSLFGILFGVLWLFSCKGFEFIRASCMCPFPGLFAPGREKCGIYGSYACLHKPGCLKLAVVATFHFSRLSTVLWP